MLAGSVSRASDVPSAVGATERVAVGLAVRVRFGVLLGSPGAPPRPGAGAVGFTVAIAGCVDSLRSGVPDGVAVTITSVEVGAGVIVPLHSGRHRVCAKATTSATNARNRPVIAIHPVLS